MIGRHTQWKADKTVKNEAKKKKLNQSSILVLILTFLTTTPAMSTTFQLVPSVVNANAGDTPSIAIVVSNLGAGSAPSVGDFDFDVAYDDTILTATSVQFSSLLGDLGVPEAIAGSVLSISGVVDLFEVSLLSNAELDALQPASFTLATLNFNAVATGSSLLSFSQSILDDSFAQTLIQQAIQVVESIPTLSEWGSILLAIGLFWVGARVLRRRYSNAG